jgi:hypothetical protein
MYQLPLPRNGEFKVIDDLAGKAQTMFNQWKHLYDLIFLDIQYKDAVDGLRIRAVVYRLPRVNENTTGSQNNNVSGHMYTNSGSAVNNDPPFEV